MRKTLLCTLTALFLLGAAPRAEAKIFEVWGSGLAGYGVGNGKTSKDFYRWIRGGAFGAEVGIKVLFIGAFIDYLYWVGDEANASLLTFNLGGDWSIDLVGGLSLVLRAAFGYYHGILPDDAYYELEGIKIESKDIQTRGIGARGGVGLRYSFAKVLSVGITPEIGYHYFFGGSETSITENNSHGWDFSALAYFRVGFGF